MKILYIILTFSLIFVVPTAFAQSIDGKESIFGAMSDQTILLEISADGKVHVTHDVEYDTSTPRYIEFIKGTTSNIEVYDSKSGEEVEFGVAGLGDIGGIQLYTLSPVLVEYDLDDALEFVNGIWYWDYAYAHGTANFYLPDQVDFVYVNDRYAALDDAKGLSCHGCGLKLAYYIDVEPKIMNAEWESEKFPVEIISQNKLINFNFIQKDKIISFETEGSQLVTLKIPLELLWNPYQVYFKENSEKSPQLVAPQNVGECIETQDKISIQGTTKCYDKIFNNEIEIDEKNVLLTVHPKKAGTIIILGTSAIPEFSLFLPLVIGILMVVLLQFRRKNNFNFSSIP